MYKPVGTGPKERKTRTIYLGLVAFALLLFSYSGLAYYWIPETPIPPEIVLTSPVYPGRPYNFFTGNDFVLYHPPRNSWTYGDGNSELVSLWDLWQENDKP